MATAFPGLPVPLPDADAVRGAVAAITARDPGFNLDGFLAQAQQAFWLVGRAHAECRPELGQTVLSPSLFGRERAAIDDSCHEGTAMAPQDEDCKTGQLVSIATDGSSDTAVVHFVSTWHRVSGKAATERRAQNWCFQRPPGARTAQTHEGEHCSNCGAPLGASAGTCRYCGAAIGAGSGWQVIRIDDVGAQEAAEAVAAMRSIVGEFVALRQSAQPPTPAPVAVRARRQVGCMPVVVFVLLVAVAGVLGAAGGSGPLHRDVAAAVPSLRHPRLAGSLSLDGQIVGPRISAAQVPPRFEFRGTCASQAVRTDWTFTAKLPDGSRFTLQVGLPPAGGGPGTYRRPQVSVSADAQNATHFVSWTAQSGGNATLSVRADGGGDLQFSGLPAGQNGGSPLSGHLAWACTLS